MKSDNKIPFSHLVSVARLPRSGMPLKLVATAKECAALAEAHDLLGVASFNANLLITSWRGEGVKVKGTILASITQECGITLEPLEAVVNNEFEATYVPEGSKLARVQTDENGEMLLDAEGPDAPETFVGESLDVGQVAEEFFELGINPYPRKDGATFDTVDEADEAPSNVSPFAKLAALRQKQ
jgi:uncharacterized metal-binding protein YceD (DUF177 family)